jgi:hypothetical protein
MMIMIRGFFFISMCEIYMVHMIHFFSRFYYLYKGFLMVLYLAFILYESDTRA